MGIIQNVREAVGRRTTVTTIATQLNEMGTRLRAEQENNLLLQESLADLELALEDRGWEALLVSGQEDFTRKGLDRAAALGRLMVIANPLIKRAIETRIGYIFGEGVQVAARARGTEGGQDVNAVIEQFWNDPSNRSSFTGDQAQEELERAHGTDGNTFLACFTTPRTGRVQVRSIPFNEIKQIITNPDDRKEPWFYRREWVQRTFTADGTETVSERQVAYYPDIKYNPRQKQRTIDGAPVIWTAPICHTSVNRLDGWLYGIGDAYAGIPWARAYKEFLEDWATLVKSLSRFAWRITAGNKSKAQKARSIFSKVTAVNPTTGQDMAAGAASISTPDLMMEPMPKTGATIDSNSGRPLAAMVAAALGVPITALLGDPGITGARAVAETLAKPVQKVMEQRRSVWEEAYRTICQYVIDQAALAPRGRLQGGSVYDPFTRTNTVVLAGDTDRTIEIQWPDLSEDTTKDRVDAIVQADGTGKVPPLVISKLLLQALGVDDVDTLLEKLVDDEGNFIDPILPAVRDRIEQTRPSQEPQEQDAA